ncbi:hypothetical protein E2C01_061635 [Portunus trituberculatus]|uniref:Uncharacterized protein n=1 Tax=Portunus trituberculatus TaxID=210409 RepID=A0A5B7HC73_PORTR|nr:hypothetical protein [Portunus trituberculatus]
MRVASRRRFPDISSARPPMCHTTPARCAHTRLSSR